MSEPSLGFGDYLKEAFKRKVRIPMLGGLPLNIMGLGAFVVAGIANPGFWFLGAAAEVAYLFGLASSKRFQNLIKAEHMLESQEEQQQQLDQTLARLSGGSKRRYLALLGQARLILGPKASGKGIADMRSQGLQQMLSIFLRLLISRDGMMVSLRKVDAPKLRKEASRTAQQISQLDPEGEAPLKRSLEGTLEIQKKRLENLGRTRSSLDVVEAELKRIEQQFELIQEESVVRGSSEHLSTRLDSVTSAMQETNEWMNQHAELLGDLGEGELPDAGLGLPDVRGLSSSERKT